MYGIEGGGGMGLQQGLRCQYGGKRVCAGLISQIPAGVVFVWVVLWLRVLGAISGGAEFTVGAYNLENYSMGGDSAAARAKPEASRDAVVQGILEMRADVVGVCEVGGERGLRDLRLRLAGVGVEYPEAELVQGPDRDRCLALLSRYPLVRRDSVSGVPYELHGRPQWMKRGILDVTVDFGGGYRVRLVGVHLKSRLASREGEELQRRMEAHVLREHVDRVLEADPSVRLLVYGDLNETRDQPAIRELVGERGGGKQLFELVAEDAAGERWTHYWKSGEVYSRIDYFLANRRVRGEVSAGRGRVHRWPGWSQASDHRPISVTLSAP